MTHKTKNLHFPKIVSEFYKKHPLKTFNSEGKTVEYISSGKGKNTAVLFPGGGQTAQSNFGMIETLESYFRIISPTLYDLDSIDQFCRILDSLLNHEQIGKIYIYGLSVGGLLAQSYLFRNPQRVKKIIISHACTPSSKVFKTKVVLPLKILKIFLPFIPDKLIRLAVKKGAMKFQGGNIKSSSPDPWLENKRNSRLIDHFSQEFIDKYLTKTLLQTWINIDIGFTKEEFDNKKIQNWSGQIMILNTDNDPLVGMDPDFQKLYPKAKMHIFHGTGHLTFFFQYTPLINLVDDFFRSK